MRDNVGYRDDILHFAALFWPHNWHTSWADLCDVNVNVASTQWTNVSTVRSGWFMCVITGHYHFNMKEKCPGHLFDSSSHLYLSTAKCKMQIVMAPAVLCPICYFSFSCRDAPAREKQSEMNGYRCMWYLPFCGPAYAMTRAVPSSAANTMAVTHNARFCEQTATPFRVCRPPLLSPPIMKRNRLILDDASAVCHSSSVYLTILSCRWRNIKASRNICSPAPPYIVNMIYCCRITLSAKPAIYDQNGAKTQQRIRTHLTERRRRPILDRSCRFVHGAKLLSPFGRRQRR